jgi:hypothetical protein
LGTWSFDFGLQGGFGFGFALSFGFVLHGVLVGVWFGLQGFFGLVVL